LNSTAAQANYGSTLWAPTSSTFSTNLSLGGDRDAIAYCWHEVEGFSKFGSYTGNGNADGPFVYTGFKPAWVMTKRTNDTSSWVIFDSTRSKFNQMSDYLLADSSAAEVGASGTADIDFVSNGFKLRSNPAGFNASGDVMIYMAFAEHPFVGDGTSPVTAR